MARDGYAKFKNDQGVPEIRIGIKEFKCAGASAPQDHPHIYLDMGAADTILCAYCATLPREHPLIVPRHHGVRSAMVMDFLRNGSFDYAWNLAGGIDAWARLVEPAMPRF